MKNTFPVKLLLLLALMIIAPLSRAAGGVEQMTRFLEELDRLQASFTQTVFNQETQETISSHGTFYLRRPDQFRWDYAEPEEQQIVADGRQIWVYDPELEQVSVQSQEEALKGTPAMLLINGDRIESHFEVIDLGERVDQGWVELLPRDEESQFIRILLAFSDNQLVRMEMADKFGQITRFQFSDIVEDPYFTSRFFNFETPVNVDVYNR